MVNERPVVSVVRAWSGAPTWTTGRLAGHTGWLVGWLVDIFRLDHSWTPMPNAVRLSLQIKQTQKLTFSV